MIGRGTWRWMLLAFLGASVAALAVVIVAPVIANARAERQDRETINEIAQIYRSDLKLEDMAKQIEIRIADIRSVTQRHDENVKLARIYTDMGESLYHRNSLSDAEQAYRKANQLDGTDARAMADLGELYSSIAAKQPLVDDRLVAFNESIRWWNQAADASGADATLVKGYEERAAEVYLAEGHALLQAARYEEADNAIHEGLTLVPEESSLAHKLGDLRLQASSGVIATRPMSPHIITTPLRDSSGH